MAARSVSGASTHVAEQPRAHRRHRTVEHVEQRPRALRAAHRLHEFEVAARHLIQRHHASRSLEHRPAEVRQPAGLQLAQIPEQRAGRADRRGIFRADAESLERCDAELSCELVGGERRIELPSLARCHERILRAGPASGRRRGALLGDQHLARREARQRRFQVRGCTAHEAQFPRGEIGRGDAVHPADLVHRAEEVVAGAVEHVVREHGARRDGLDDLAPHDPLGHLGVLHLLADRDAEALAHEAAQIFVQRLRGHARERHLGGAAVVA